MAEIVWESDAQSNGFMVMSNGMVWPDDWPGTLVEAQFTSARGDGADLDRDPDMVPSGPGRVIFTPLVRTVGYDGEHGKRIVSLHPFEAVVGDDGFLYTPDEYGQPGIRGIVLPSNDSAVVDEHDWTWRVTFDIPDTTIRPTHIPTPHDHSVDIKDYLDSDANYGVRVVVDRVAARETLTARDETLAARDLVLPARDQTLDARDQTLQHGITVDTSVGTKVTLGGHVIHYDSGWRDVKNLLPDHWEVRSVGQHRMWLKRENDLVTLMGRVAYTEGDHSLDGFTYLLTGIPTGFRSAFGFTVAGLALFYQGSRVSSSSGQGEVSFAGTTSLGVIFHSRTGKWANDNGLGFTLSWHTNDTIPTSLPGTPA